MSSQRTLSVSSYDLWHEFAEDLAGEFMGAGSTSDVVNEVALGSHVTKKL